VLCFKPFYVFAILQYGNLIVPVGAASNYPFLESETPYLGERENKSSSLELLPIVTLMALLSDPEGPILL